MLSSLCLLHRAYSDLVQRVKVRVLTEEVERFLRDIDSQKRSMLNHGKSISRRYPWRETPWLAIDTLQAHAICQKVKESIAPSEIGWLFDEFIRLERALSELYRHNKSRMPTVEFRKFLDILLQDVKGRIEALGQLKEFVGGVQLVSYREVLFATIGHQISEEQRRQG